MRNSRTNEEESNNSIVPFLSSRTLSSNLYDHPRIPGIPASNQPNVQFQINMMGNMKDCNFYIPDATGDNTAMAFRLAYNLGQPSKNGSTSINNNELCACVGSMLCSVVPAFRNSVEAALNGSGIRPRFVSFPSQAQVFGIQDNNLPQLDWCSILCIFGYCILIIFKIDSDQFGLKLKQRKGPNGHRFQELQDKLRCSPSNYFSRVPFDTETENTIRTILGSHALRTSIINFLVNNFNHSDPQICSLCQYLSYVLSWSGDMRVYTVMKERLIMTNSPVLSDSRVIAEVENLKELTKAVTSHTYPQYFNHMCSTAELFYLDVSRFPTLCTVALMLEKEEESALQYEVISGANTKTVNNLLKLHRTTMGQN